MVNQPAVSADVSRKAPSKTPRRMALIDSQGKIVAVNHDWLLLAEQTGADLKRIGTGANYFEVCRLAGRSSAEPRKALTGILEVLKENSESFAMDYGCETPAGPAYFRMGVTLIPYKNARAAVSHTDITDVQLRRIRDFNRAQDFARKLIHAQEEERQRISREIHDDLGSQIALMSFSVRRVFQQEKGDRAAMLSEMNNVVDGLMKLSEELRNISHRLHPPSLRYVGIGAALKSLGITFEQTRGVEIEVRVPQRIPKLSEAIELCLFRIAQECLQNIAKHSGAEKGRIVLDCTSGHLRLTVSDGGRGFVPAEGVANRGIGLMSMEERALSVGGILRVQSSPGKGCTIQVDIPLRQDVADFQG